MNRKIKYKLVTPVERTESTEEPKSLYKLVNEEYHGFLTLFLDSDLTYMQLGDSAMGFSCVLEKKQ